LPHRNERPIEFIHVSQKAKSENKFYSAMRDKEAVDGERKILARDLERQAKVLEKFMAAEKNLRDQLVCHFPPLVQASHLKHSQNTRDQTVQVMQEAIDKHLATVQTLLTDKMDCELRYRGEQKKAEDVSSPPARCRPLFDVLFFSRSVRDGLNKSSSLRSANPKCQDSRACCRERG
jgi:hypothetical protein